MSNPTEHVPAVIARAAAEQSLELNPQNVNLLLPTQTFGDIIGEYDRISLEVVSIDPDPEAGEVYEIVKAKGDKPARMALCKPPLDRLLSALGIILDPANTGVIESSPRKSRAKATGAIRKPNGEWVVMTEEKTVDLDAFEDEIRLKQEEYAERGWPTGKWSGGRPVTEPWSKHGGEPAKQQHIDLETRRAMITLRKFKDERAVTGARERLVKALVGLRNTYTTAELTRPFVIPRVTTDMAKMLADPTLREAAAQKISGSIRAIFGPGAREVQAEELPPYPEIEAEVAPEEPAAAEAKTEASEESEAGESSGGFLTPAEEARKRLADWAEDPKIKADADAPGTIAAILDDKDARLAELQAMLDRCEAFAQKKAEGGAE